MPLVLLSVSVATLWRLVMFRHNPAILASSMVWAPIVADCCNGGLFGRIRGTRVGAFNSCVGGHSERCGSPYRMGWPAVKATAPLSGQI